MENFCWIKRGIDNRIVREESPFFLRSKVTCLILRKVRVLVVSFEILWRVVWPQGVADGLSAGRRY